MSTFLLEVVSTGLLAKTGVAGGAAGTGALLDEVAVDLFDDEVGAARGRAGVFGTADAGFFLEGVLDDEGGIWIMRTINKCRRQWAGGKKSEGGEREGTKS